MLTMTNDKVLQIDVYNFVHVIDPNDCKFGGNDCCTEEKPCKEDEGDCDNDDECAGNLKCGEDNCIGDAFDHSDDCCIGKPNIYLETKIQFLTRLRY